MTELLRDLDIRLHAPAGDVHFPVERAGVFDDLRDAVQERAEGRDDDPALGVADEPFESFRYFPFTLRVPGLQSISWSPR